MNYLHIAHQAAGIFLKLGRQIIELRKTETKKTNQAKKKERPNDPMIGLFDAWKTSRR